MRLPTKKIITIGIFFLLTPLDLALVFIGLHRAGIEKKAAAHYTPPEITSLPTHIYAALPADSGEVAGVAVSADSRALIIERYLERYNSPMTPHNEVATCIVEVCDEINMDWRLLVAIAQQESNLGKKMPENCHNAWGYGIHSRGTLCFETWEEGINAVARGLKKKYLDQGLTSPEEIMAKYTPHSNGSWAYGVNQFLEELQFGEID